MSVPTQADLLGFEWGFGGDPFVEAAAKTLDSGFAEWSLGGVPLLFNLDSGDDAADRVVTALNAMVLAGNPSTADAMVTVLRKAILRTQDYPNADRLVTQLALQVLRAVRRGDVARPSGQGRVVFNDNTYTPGEGEFSISGYLGISSPVTGWTGYPYFPDTYVGPDENFDTLWSGEEPTVGPSRTPFQIGFGGGGDFASVVRKWHEGLIAQPLYIRTFSDQDEYRYPIQIIAESTDYGNGPDGNPWDTGGQGAYPVGMSAGPLTQKTYGSTALHPQFPTSINADFTLGEPHVLGLLTIQVEPHPEAQQWALSAFSVYSHVRYQEGYAQTWYYQRTAVTINTANWGGTREVVHVCPKLNFSHLMGRGAYRIAPNSYRDWAVQEDGLPPIRLPLQGSNDPLEEMYGITYGSEKALWEALVANPDLSPMNLDWPTPDGHTFYKQSTDHLWWPVIPHRWGPATEQHPAAFAGERFLVFDDGRYVTKTGELRYSRYKTLMMHQHLAFDREVDLSGEPVDLFLSERLARSYVPMANVGDPLPSSGGSWDFSAVTATFILYGESVEPGVIIYIIGWLQAVPGRYDYYVDKAVNGGTADEAKVFWTQYMTEENPAWIDPVNAAWDAREDEIENAPPPDYTKWLRVAIPQIAWDADDNDPTIYDGTYLTPVFFLEKLDSPSTHFNDPPGTPGVDDL